MLTSAGVIVSLWLEVAVVADAPGHVFSSDFQGRMRALLPSPPSHQLCELLPPLLAHFGLLAAFSVCCLMK